MSTLARILVVEDDADMRLFLQEEMRVAGYDVVLVGDGMSALEELARLPIDVMITDLMMPGMKGSELLVQVRAIDREIEILARTLHRASPRRERLFLASTARRFRKPFSRACSSVTAVAPSPTRGRTGAVSFRRPRAERSCSTRSETCP